jgi:hypothetical protein
MIVIEPQFQNLFKRCKLEGLAKSNINTSTHQHINTLVDHFQHPLHDHGMA